MKKTYFVLPLLFLFCPLISQEITIDRNVRMLALGDSYTIGQSVEINERWPHQFIDELNSLGVNAEAPDYIATTGWTTRRLIQGINTMLDKEKNYNLVSILIGVNNQYQGVDISSYEPDLREIIDKALRIAAYDSSRVFILSIPDWAYTPFGGGGSNISDEIDDYNAIKKRIAAEYGIAYIDITPISRQGLNNPSLVAGDGLHPSGDQYREWVKSIIPRLRLDQSLTAHFHDSAPTDQLRVYPNPAGSSLHIESSRAIERIQIYNLLGGLVSDQVISETPVLIDLSHLIPGTYTLCIPPSGQSDQALKRMFIVEPG